MIRSLSRACQSNGFPLLRRYKCNQSNQSACRTKKASCRKKVEPAVLKELDAEFEKLKKSKSQSLLKKYLTPELFKQLRRRSTKKSTLLDCIRSGLKNHDSGCGVYAADPECYTVFADLFDPIIRDYHFGFKKSDCHPAKSFGNPCHFSDLDPHVNYIASTRIRCARSVQGYPFNPCMTKQNYDDLEDLVHCALTDLGSELKGTYYPLLGMDKTIQKKLIDDHFLFKEGDRFLQAANASRFWPTGRGIYHNYEKTFLVWCNEEDHIRIISMQRGGNFQEVFSRLIRGVNGIGQNVQFIHDDRLGFLTFCPTNLGTTIRASVHIRVPKLAADPKKFKAVADKYKLQVRGTRGEHSEAEGGIYDISNKRRMGITEFEAVEEIYKGITEIINLEKSLKGPTKKVGRCARKYARKKEPCDAKQCKPAQQKAKPKPAIKPAPKAGAKKPAPKAGAKKPPPKAEEIKPASKLAAKKAAKAAKAAPPPKAAPEATSKKRKRLSQKKPPPKVEQKKPPPKKTGKKPDPKGKK